MNVMNQLLSRITTLRFCLLCLLCLFIVVIHADITEITDVNSSSIDAQQQKESSPSQTSTDDPIPSSSLPSPTNINNNNGTDYNFTCYAAGECVPCDAFEKVLEEDLCGKFGNKEPVECQWNTPDDESAGNITYLTLPKFRPCKRVIKLERTKYFEFQFINIFIAFMSCSILIWRKKKLATEGYRKLSRRIRGNI